MSRSPLARLGFAVLAVVLAATSLATPAHAAAETGTTRTAETGTVRGQLTDDTGTSIENAVVTVYTTAAANSLGTTTTDAHGQFTIDDIPAGKAKVQFQAGTLEQWATRQTGYEDATVLTVNPGETLTVNERLLPTGRVTGRLTDTAGAPVASAGVGFLTPDGGSTSYGQTDGDGRYSVIVPPGTYQVRFHVSAVEQWARQKRDADTAESFEVLAGKTVVVDEQLLPTGGVAGRLLDSAGKPVTEAYVNLHHHSNGGTTPGYAMTDEDGRYTFEAALPGSYKVSFSLPNGATRWFPGKRDQALAQAVTVTAGEITTVNETLAATGSIAGRFTDERGNGLKTFGIEVSAADAGGGDTNIYHTDTNPDGTFRIDGILVDDYIVVFVNPTTGRRQYAYGKGSAAEADLIAVKAGATTTVNDQLVAGAQLRITAKDAATGGPVQGFCAHLSGPGDAGGCTEGAELLVADLAAGQYDVWAGGDEGSLYLPAQAKVTVVAGQVSTLSIDLAQGPGPGNGAGPAAAVDQRRRTAALTRPGQPASPPRPDQIPRSRWADQSRWPE
ncbi:MAG TPA: carboxypeptidase-like regulatory domain-containing protein [Catenuloplanes sp.]|jgi:hypothetical protein